VLRKHKLAIKQSKCTFGAQSVAYLNHIISNSGVAMDPEKVEAIKAWPTLTSVRVPRGFLGLTGYYRKFIKDYAAVARRLTLLLKNEVFHWSSAADDAFDALKRALTEGPVQQLPDFDRAFIVNYDGIKSLYLVSVGRAFFSAFLSILDCF
jgi:hypothetical protein